MFISYLKTYARMGLKAIPMAADTGPIGGDMSHEFLILADTGESQIACHKDYFDMDWSTNETKFKKSLDDMVDNFTSKYAATDEKRDIDIERALGDKLVTARGIEVGHIFYFGTKYSEKLGATVNGPKGDKIAVEMGSYGIGISRLVGAIIEAFHDKNGIIWPDSVSPFKVGLINLKSTDQNCNEICNLLYQRLIDANIEVLYDDREERAGVKFAEMDLIGLSWQLIVGPRNLKDGNVELKNRKTGNLKKVTIENALNLLSE